MLEKRKAVMIGCGFVGSATVFSLMESGLFSDIAMIDAEPEKAEGEAMDISHGIPFSQQMKIYAGSYEDVRDAAIVMITAGANQKPGETRIDLTKKNIGIFEKIIPKIVEKKFEGILLVVANPVDILTDVAQRLSGFPKHRVIGSGTVLDTARLIYRLSEHLGVASKNIQAFIVGEHGDSEIAIWSSANVAGIPLNDFCQLRGHYEHEKATKEIAQQVKNSAYEIIERKKVTNYGVAVAVRRICETIVRDEKAILPVSVRLQGQYGIENVVLSMPCVVGKEGIETIVPISLNKEEEQQLRQSAELLKQVLRAETRIK